MTIECLEAEITEEELRDWEAFDLIQPIGDDRQDLLIASVCQLLANINRGRNQDAFKIQDFLLQWGVSSIEQIPRTSEETAQEAADVFRALAMKGGESIEAPPMEAPPIDSPNEKII